MFLLDQHTRSLRWFQHVLLFIYTPSTWTSMMLSWSSESGLLNVLSKDYSHAWSEKLILSASVFSALKKRGWFFQSAEGDFWTGRLSQWWMSLPTGRPFSMARFAQLESKQCKPTDWPNTNGPFKRSAADLLTLVQKDLAAVMRTKGLKEDTSSNWAGFLSTKGTRTRALTAFLF